MVKIKPIEVKGLPEVSIYPYEGGIREILLDKTLPKKALKKGTSVLQQPVADTFVKSKPISHVLDEGHKVPAVKLPAPPIKELVIPYEGGINHIILD